MFAVYGSRLRAIYRYFSLSRLNLSFGIAGPGKGAIKPVMRRRENTFRIEYANVPKKPSFEEVHEFIGTVLGMTHEEVKRIQCSRTVGCAFVTASDLSVAQRVVEQHDDKHDIEFEGKLYRLRLKMEDGAVDVKLYDLPIDVMDDQITEFLSDYGEVLSIHEQMWGATYLFGGYPTGVRIAKMVVKHNIPSYITIDGETTHVSYYRQQLTCRHCTEFVHSGISCIQNKKLLIQKLSVDPNAKSYANVVGQSTGPKLAPRLTSTLKQQSGRKHGGKKQVEAVQPATNLGTRNTSSSWQIVGKKSVQPSIQTLLASPRAGSESTASKQTDESLFKQPHIPLAESLADVEFVSCLPGRKHDGGETDSSSTSSTGSRRKRRSGKKMRPDDNGVMVDGENIL